jgi:hypothetical protein
MSQKNIEKVVRVSSSTDPEVATVTTQVIQGSTQQSNSESVTLEIQ